MIKNPPTNVGDMRHRFDSWFREIPRRRPWQPFQDSSLENSMDRGACQATVHGVIKSQTQLSNSHTHTHTHTCSNENIYLAFIFCQALLNFCVISTFLMCVFLSLWSIDLEWQDQKIFCFEVWANCFFLNLGWTHRYKEQTSAYQCGEGREEEQDSC